MEIKLQIISFISVGRGGVKILSVRTNPHPLSLDTDWIFNVYIYIYIYSSALSTRFELIDTIYSLWIVPFKSIHRLNIHHIYIYIYIYVCVCVCVCVLGKRFKKRMACNFHAKFLTIKKKKIYVQVKLEVPVCHQTLNRLSAFAAVIGAWLSALVWSAYEHAGSQPRPLIRWFSFTKP